MHVSSANIIRFPEPMNDGRIGAIQPGHGPAEVVAFPSDREDPLLASSQEHGLIHAAHRIADRVAADLDSIAPL